jgi:hypothetical protein
LIDDEDATIILSGVVPGIVFPTKFVFAGATEILVGVVETQRMQELMAHGALPAIGEVVSEAA